MFQSVFIYVYFKCLKIIKIYNICCNFLFLFLMVLGIGTGPCPQLVDAQSLRFSSCAQQAGTQTVSFSSNFWNFLKQRTNLKTAQDYSSQLLTQQSQAQGPENLSQRKIAFLAFPGAAMQLTAFPFPRECRLVCIPCQHNMGQRHRGHMVEAWPHFREGTVSVNFLPFARTSSSKTLIPPIPA